MSRAYGILAEPTPSGKRQWIAVYSGTFSDQFEGQGYARPGTRQITITLDYDGKVIVRLPEGVTFPRGASNYQEIDDAIRAAINAHRQKPEPDLPPGDSVPKWQDVAPIPGADERTGERA